MKADTRTAIKDFAGKAAANESDPPPTCDLMPIDNPLTLKIAGKLDGSDWTVELRVPDECTKKLGRAISGGGGRGAELSEHFACFVTKMVKRSQQAIEGMNANVALTMVVTYTSPAEIGI